MAERLIYVAGPEWAQWCDEYLTGCEYESDLEAAADLAAELPPCYVLPVLTEAMLRFVRERAALRY